MNEKTKRIYNIYLFGAALLTLTITVLRTLAVTRQLDLRTGYFALNSGVNTASNILTVVSVILCLSAAPALAGRMQVKHRAPHLPTLFSSAFVAFLLISFAFFHFCEIVSVLRDVDAMGTLGMRRQIIFSSCIAIAFSLFGASGFILAASGTAELSARKAFSSCFVVLFCIMYTMFLYFETSLPLNADVKLLSQAALLAASVFFLYDARVALGKPKWAIHTAVGFAAMLVTASVSLPNLIYYLLYRESVLETPVHDFLLFGFFLYILARTTSLCDRKPASAEGFFGEALEMSRLTDTEQISFFGAELEQPIDEAEAEELLAPPAEPEPIPPADPEEPAEEIADEVPEPAQEPVEQDEDLSALDLFSAPSESEETMSENDVLTTGTATQADTEEPRQ